jgi:ParB family chromosome partitioning protein
MTEPKVKPGRLGRGLASLLGETDMGSRVNEQPSVLPITTLTPGPFQPRRDMAEDTLEELTASIRAHGVLQPILVRPSPDDSGSFQIIAGERRWRASQRAGLHEVPVHIRALDDASALAAALIENLQRQDLNAIEEAEGLRRLADEFGLTQEMVAVSVGKSRSHIANTLRLLALPASIQADVRRGALSAGHARALLSHPDPAKAALSVLARGLNVRQTEALARSGDRTSAEPKDSNPLLDHQAVERDLTAVLGLKTRVVFDGRSGQLIIRYSTLDHLDGLIRLLRGGETTP